MYYGDTRNHKYVCTLLSADAFYRAYQLKQKNTVVRRNRQVKIDACIDFICAAVPLSTLWFYYQLSISVPEMIQIIVWPSLCLFSKLRSILREIIRVRTDNAVRREQKKLSLKANRNRKSLFRRSNSVKISELQQQWMPNVVSAGFCVYNVAYGFFFLVVAIVHVVAEPPHDCDVITWAEGCVNKIPFCNSLFEPDCNCASLFIENNKSLIALPIKLADKMRGLRKVYIGKCNLTKLPPNMEQLTEMVHFEIPFNRLQTFEVDILKWEKLDFLWLSNNELKSYHPTALWTHPHLRYLDVSDNIGLQLPKADSEIAMPALLYFGCRNNSVTIQLPFDKNRFPNLLYLFLNGNRLIQFPDVSLQETLQNVGIARCHVKSIPSNFAEFKHLEYIDARDNNISVVNDDLKMLINTNGAESYFSGNPACNTDATLNCKLLCSKYCFSNKVLGNKICNLCNSEECEYDGNDCL